MNQVIPENGHVYFIRLGNASQKEVKKRAFEQNDPVVLIGYDKEVTLKSLIKCINDCQTCDNDPEDDSNKIIFNNGLVHPQGKSEDIPQRAKDALRRFALARPGIDYFFTFYEKKLYYGTPRTRIDTDIFEKQTYKYKDIEFRTRSLEWSCVYNDDKNGEILSDEISGIISRINMFQETVYMLSEPSVNSSVIDTVFCEHTVFFDVINNRFPKIIQTAFDVVANNIDCEKTDIKEKVDCITTENNQKVDLKGLIINLCNYLHPAAFEKFVDIAYTSQGYSRCSELGGNMKDIDMEYIRFNPDSTYEHLVVQVKSQIQDTVLEKILYKITSNLKEMECHVVTHGDNIKSLKDVQDKINCNPKVETHYVVKSVNELLDDCPDCRILMAFLFINLGGRDLLKSNLKTLNSL